MVLGVNNFVGLFSGFVEFGWLDINLKNSILFYGDMFCVLLEVSQVSGIVNWQVDDNGWELWSDQLDVRVKLLWVNGNFCYMQLDIGQLWFKILSGICLYDVVDVWCYFLVFLMGGKLVDYLIEVLYGGQVDNVMLIYNGNFYDFFYKYKEGQFQVYVLLCNVIFQFQLDWFVLDNLVIDFDFFNEGLWMNVFYVMLGKVIGSNISVIILDYLKEKFYVDVEVVGEGCDVYDYFIKILFNDLVVEILEELQVGGNVSGCLYLDILLEENCIIYVSGEVILKNNSLLIKLL